MNAEATGPKKKKNNLLGPVYVGYRLCGLPSMWATVYVGYRLWAATVYGQ